MPKSVNPPLMELLRRTVQEQFREALHMTLVSAITLTLASAVVWARRMISAGSLCETAGLLLPEIFDSARSQRFGNRNL